MVPGYEHYRRPTNRSINSSAKLQWYVLTLEHWPRLASLWFSSPAPPFMPSNHISDICLILVITMNEQSMGFQNNSSLQFYPQTNLEKFKGNDTLLIHMMKTSIVGNRIKRPLTGSGLSAYYISSNLLKHWRWDDKLKGCTGSWEECKRRDSEFSSSMRANGLWRKKEGKKTNQSDMAVCRNNINCKDCRNSALVLFFAVGKTSVVERGVGGVRACGCALTGDVAALQLHMGSSYHQEKSWALTEGQTFTELWVINSLTAVWQYSVGNQQAERKQIKLIFQICMCRKRANLSSVQL